MKRTWKRLLPAAALLALPCQAVRADEVSAPAQAEAAKEGAAAATPGEAPSGGGGGLGVESAPAAEAGPATGGGAGMAGVIGVAIPQSVDEAISHALRLNPEVQLARAKVDEARAAYNQTRLKVVAEITQLMRKRDSLQQMSEFQAEQAKAKLQAAVRDYERAKSLAQQGNLSAEFVQEAEDALQSAKLDDRQKQLERQQAVSNTDAQLLLLIGIEPGGATSGPQQFLGMAMGGASGFAAERRPEGPSMGIIAGGMGPAGMGGAAVMGGGLGGPVRGDVGTAAAAATTPSGPEGADGSSAQAARGAATGGAGFGGRGSGGGAMGTGAGGMGGGGGAMMGMMGGGGGMVTAPAFGRPPVPERQEHLREELEKPTRLDVTESPLGDIVTLLKQQHNIEMQIGPGVDSARPITMSVNGVTLKEMLLLMTDLYPDLCFIVRDYGLLVSTREKGVDLFGAAIPADLPLEVAPPGMQGGGGGYQGGGFQ